VYFHVYLYIRVLKGKEDGEGVAMRRERTRKGFEKQWSHICSFAYTCALPQSVVRVSFFNSNPDCERFFGFNTVCTCPYSTLLLFSTHFIHTGTA